MLAVLYRVTTSRADVRVQNVLPVQVLPGVEAIKVEQPTEDHHLLWDHGVQNVRKHGVCEIRVGPTSGESCTVKQSPSVRNLRESHILQQRV